MPRSHPRLSRRQKMILEKETYKEFGYYSYELKPHSDKFILAACDDCGKIRTLRKNQYSSLCRSCATKGERNYGWKGGKIKCICEYCETTFKIPPSFIKYGRGKYCSCSCNSKALRQKSHPGKTRPEIIFETICKKYNLPFKYTGDGAFWIGKNPSINPDFVECNGKKIAVEIFSYWHDPLRRHCKVRYSHTYEGRKKILKKHKWVLVVFWQEDLEREDAEQFILSEMQKQGIM